MKRFERLLISGASRCCRKYFTRITDEPPPRRDELPRVPSDTSAKPTPSLRIPLAVLVFSAILSAHTHSAEKPEIISVQKISAAAPHSAFTDLVRFNGEWLCAFREGKGHVSEDGAIRIISSDNLQNWFTWSHVTKDGIDLRDPKICLTPNGELMLTTAGADRSQKPVVHESYSWLTRDGRKWEGPFTIGDKNMWLWRVTWHKGTAYSVGYNTSGEKHLPGRDALPRVRLYTSKDGKKFDVLVPKLFDEGYPNETGMVFLDDDTALCLLRRDGEQASGKLGSAKPPYTDWSWKDLGVRIGGPAMIQIPDKRLIAAVRLYDAKVRTSIVQIDPATAKLTELLALPSGGDTSYAGLVWHNDTLVVSYYSSHEGKTAIYLARVRM